jgi:hypothetical protein
MGEERDMRKTVLFGGLIALVGLVSYTSTHAQSSSTSSRSLHDKLVGTWRFVEYFDTDTAGTVTYPFGEHPDGYIVWDDTGHVFVQVARGSALKPFASGDNLRGTDLEVRTAFERYDAYFGTYEVDEKNSVVIHHAADNLRPSYTGTDQRRPFRFQSDSTLIIENILSNGRGNGYRELVRVR